MPSTAPSSHPPRAASLNSPSPSRFGTSGRGGGGVPLPAPLGLPKHGPHNCVKPGVEWDERDLMEKKKSKKKKPMHVQTAWAATGMRHTYMLVCTEYVYMYIHCHVQAQCNGTRALCGVGKMLPACHRTGLIHPPLPHRVSFAARLASTQVELKVASQMLCALAVMTGDEHPRKSSPAGRRRGGILQIPRQACRD